MPVNWGGEQHLYDFFVKINIGDRCVAEKRLGQASDLSAWYRNLMNTEDRFISK